MAELTIVGAGVAGLCVATELAARGVPFRIIDRGGVPGPHACSWWAGGMLAPFCEGENAEEPVVRLGQQAAPWWQHHTGKVSHNGSLVVALDRDRKELDRFAHRTSEHQWLDRDVLATIEPDLASRVSEALFFAGEAHIAPRVALQTLTGNLAARGVTIERGEDVPTTSRIIDCRGLAARDAVSGLRGVKGEMVVLRCPDIELSRPVRLLHPRDPLYIVPRGEGVYMLGATQIESGERGRVTARALLELLSAAYALHPAFAEAEVIETAADARPAFPDNLPRIVEDGRVLHVNGLFRHGFLLAPALAQMVADYVTEGKRPEVFHED